MNGPRQCVSCGLAPLVSRQYAERWDLSPARVHYGRGQCTPCGCRSRRRGERGSLALTRRPALRRERTTWPRDELVAEVRCLRRVHGLSLEEVADKLGVRVASIERAFQRAGLPGGKRCGL